jgi:hypothetical protein
MASEINLVNNISDPETASLSAVEFSSLPFNPERIYWIQDFTSKAVRGNHSHKNLTQVFIMVEGSMHLEIYEGPKSRSYEFTRKSTPLIIGPGTWRIMSNASSDAVLLVIADRPYEPEDYIRDWDEYQDWYLKNNQKL